MKIIYKNENGGVSILHPTEEALSFMTIDAIAKKDVPTGLPYKIVEDSEIPADRTFRDAWVIDEAILTNRVGRMIKVNMLKAKDIAHEERRVARALQLTPLDIQTTIPAMAEQAEAKRAEIRVRFEKYQDDIDTATCTDSLKEAMLQYKECT